MNGARSEGSEPAKPRHHRRTVAEGTKPPVDASVAWRLFWERKALLNQKARDNAVGVLSLGFN
jgi:hypothetical protein